MNTRRLVALATVLLAGCTACGSSVAAPQGSPSPSAVRHASLDVDGLKRTYRLYVPPSLDPNQNVPLVVLLHWAGGTGDKMAATKYDAQAATGKFIAVYPDSTDGLWRASGDDPDFDVTFINNLLDRLTTDFRIDKARIFAAGLSIGAMMAYRLACQLSNRFVAIASVAGAMLVNDCHPALPVSILEMHGTADSTVPYKGNADFPPTRSTVQSWVKLDGCPGAPVQTAGGITTTSAWKGCRGGTSVRLDTIEGGQHVWFGSDPSGSSVAGEPDATKTSWGFFSGLAPRA